jgi:hypothetical protein
MAASSSSRRQARRSFSVLTVPDRSLADQAIGLVAPWRIHQYPGKRRAFAALIGVKVSTARAYLRGEAQLSAYHAERLAATTSNARTIISNGLIIMDRWRRT